MAVHCGACGVRLCDATENYGGFPTTPSFNGWRRELGADRAIIADTCERCHARLAAAVVTAANEIVAAHQATIDALRADLAAQRAREAAYDQERAAALAEFERGWRGR